MDPRRARTRVRTASTDDDRRDSRAACGSHAPASGVRTGRLRGPLLEWAACSAASTLERYRYRRGRNRGSLTTARNIEGTEITEIHGSESLRPRILLIAIGERVNQA
jgi:hypothetical protein